MFRLSSIHVNRDSPSVIMGVVNVAPETFYKGSMAKTPEEAAGRAMEMVREGADVIDLGAMSTAPGVEPISVREEKERLSPVVKEVRKRVDVPISIDTQRASVAEASLESGGDIINDVSGLKADPKMVQVISKFDCSVIIMAANRRPGDAWTIREISRALRESLKLCESHGVDPEKIFIDPGLGFGKGSRWDLHILARLGELASLGPPICIGPSRKHFIGQVLGLDDPADRLWGSISAAVIAILNGAKIVRTHDPRETSHAIRMAEAIMKAGEKSGNDWA